MGVFHFVITSYSVIPTPLNLMFLVNFMPHKFIQALSVTLIVAQLLVGKGVDSSWHPGISF